MWVLFPQIPRGMAKKLYRSWSGSFLVVKKLSEVTYRVQELRNRRRQLVVHFNRLKPYRQRDTRHHGQLSGEESGISMMPEKEPERHQFGSRLQIVEDDGDCTLAPTPTAQLDPRNKSQAKQTNGERRYPPRNRQPPNRFSLEYQLQLLIL